MNWRSKWVFWGVVAAVLTISAIPSIILLQAFQRYYRFLTGYEPATMRLTRTGRTPRHDRKAEEQTPLLDFVEFKISAPKAKKVAVIADFTHGRAEGLPLVRQADGVWEILVPLPPGRYHYAYLIDGALTLDPKAPAEPSGGRETSLKIVR